MPLSLQRLLAIVVVAVAPGAGELAAQEAEAAPAVEAPSVESVQQKLQELEADTGLDEALKTDLEERYEEAFTELEAAEASRERSAEYRSEMLSAPDESRRVAGEREDLEGRGQSELVSEQERELESERLGSLLEDERAALARLNDELRSLNDAIVAERSRPEEIGRETTAAQEKRRKAEASLAELAGVEETDPLKQAEAAKLRATIAAAQAEAEELEQERLSSALRMDVLVAKRELAQVRVKRLEARVGALQALAGAQLGEEVAAAKRAAAEAARAVADYPELEELASSLGKYAGEFEEVAAGIVSARTATDDLESHYEEVREEHQLVVEELKYGDTSTLLSGGVLSQRQSAATKRELERSLAASREESNNVRLAALRIDTELRRLEVPPEEEVEGDPEAALERRLLLEKRDMLASLEDAYRRLIRERGAFEVEAQRLLVLVREHHDLLAEKLFWVATVPPLSVATITDVPSGLRWMFGAERIRELLPALGAAVAASPLLAPLLLILTALGLVLRRRWREWVDSYGPKTRRISTDRYGYTVEALLIVLAQTVPVAVLLWVLGRNMVELPGASDWLQGFGEALQEVAPMLFAVLLIRELTRKNGLAESHFRWPRDYTRQLRRAATGFAIGYLPAEAIVVTCLADPSSQHLHSLVRVVFMAAMLWVAYWVAYALDPKQGIVVRLARNKTTGLLYRLRRFWRWLLVALPLAIVVMLAKGYMVAAVEFTKRTETTAMILLLSLLLYELLLRWFAIRERKLALAKLLAERRARQEAKESEDEQGEQGEELAAAQEEGEIDLVQVGAQTRQLLRSLVAFGALMALWFSWGEVNPVFRAFEDRTVFWDVTVADLLLAMLAVAGTVLVARNLPGILEIAILQNLPLDAGSRFAISTLARYVVVLIGFLIIFTLLNLEWSRFGWIAAALSVGLGFGLQEVVANFVCGLILLFERPVRVGDVITVGEVSGRVTRIRMRATTITDWDRREYLVPNKEFVTGRLLNWTLSNTVNRITVHVGVAYGTDTERVHLILTEIAAGNPVVLDDPAPIVTFSSFGDSSLNFEVRCYLPDIEQRLQVHHELHSAIHRRFAAEGIEIPFPQRDLHLRSGGKDGEN